jgi:pimeloyl-ACP methyl ester carboxylesterase
MRWIRRIVATLVALVLGLVVASFGFNVATDGHGKPVRELWHGRFVRADGVLTAYRTWGRTGTPIVLVGGFVEPSFAWARVGPLLGRRHRVYALDLDGFGYSERHGPWTLQEWADQVEDFCHAVGVRRPLVAGHSLGAAVAVELARRGVASRIVLIDGDALRGGGAPAFVRVVLARSPLLTSAVRIATRWQWPVRRILASAYGPNAPDFSRREVSRWTDQLRADGAERALRTMARREIPGFTSAQLRRLHVRATVAWGQYDDVDPRSAGEQTARDLRAPFVVLPGAGHLSMLVAPRAVAGVIER